MTSVDDRSSATRATNLVGGATLAEPPFLEAGDRPVRRDRIVRSLARYLASETARELVALSAPPRVEVTHEYEGTPVLEGSVIEARVVVHDYHRGHIQATVMVPGETMPRPFVPDQPVAFPATKTGPIIVSAKNLLNPRTVNVASSSIHVAEIPRVNPFTFTGVEVSGLTGTQVAGLAQAMTAARADGLELDPWFASGRILELSGEDQVAAAMDFNSIDELLIAMSRQLGDGLDLWHHIQAVGGPAESVRADSRGVGLLGLRSQVGAQVLLDAKAQAAVVLAHPNSPRSQPEATPLSGGGP